MRLSALLPFLAATASFAFVLRSPEAVDAGLPGKRDVSTNLFSKRNTPAKCSAKTYSADSPSRRGVPFGEHVEYADDLNRRMTLWRRVMTVPGDESMDEWMCREIAAPKTRSIIWQRKRNGEMEDMATSDYAEFATEKEAFSMSTPGLCGCTVLAVVSRSAVYVAHYWENISFWADDVFIKPKGTFADQNDAFQKTVIKGLTEGVGRATSPEQVRLKDKAKLNDPSVRAYLMIPNKNSDGKEDPYRDYWNQIRAKAKEFVPALTDANIKETKYTPHPGDDNLLENTAAGKFLFKYDPDENGNGDGTKRAAIWIEGDKTPVHDDTWK